MFRNSSANWGISVSVSSQQVAHYDSREELKACQTHFIGVSSRTSRAWTRRSILLQSALKPSQYLNSSKHNLMHIKIHMFIHNIHIYTYIHIINYIHIIYMCIYIHIYTYIHTMEGWRDDKYVTRNIETCTCEGPPSSPPIPWPVTIESVLKRICKMQKDSSCKDCPQLCHNAHCGNSDISKPILRPSCIWAQNLSGTPFLRTKSRKPSVTTKCPWQSTLLKIIALWTGFV